MDDFNTNRVMQFIGEAHERIANYARKCFRTDGRGAIQVSFPDLPAGTASIVSTSLVYHTLDEIQRVTADVTGSAREDRDILIRMIETYDPSKQAVVTAMIEGHNPITIKMKLERPVIADESGRVH
jgi:hypothetical protein